MDEGRLIGLLSELVAIESVNPAYPGVASGESGVADRVEVECRRLGLDVERDEVLPGRDNVLARLDVPGADQTLLFEVHTDTIGLEGMGDRALKPEVREGRLFGRGACDDKASLAAMLVALEALVLRRGELKTNVLLLAAADEEYRFRGILRFLEQRIPVSAAIVGEPTELRVVIAHKGVVRFRVTTRGKAAHSSTPEEGRNAIVQMATVIDALSTTERRLRDRSHPLVGQPTMNIGRVYGGTGVNVVPDRCSIEIDRRLIPGESVEDALREIDRVLANLAVHPGTRIEREDPELVSWALDTPADALITRAALTAAEANGVAGGPVGVAFGSDASKLWALRRVPAIVLGPGSVRQAHSADEYVEVAQVSAAARIYVDTVLAYSALVAGL